MVDAAADSYADGALDATDAPGERSPWTFDFGPMADVDPAACKPADAWSSGHDTSVTTDGGVAPKILWRKVLSNRSTTSYWAGNATSIFVNILGEELVAISPKDGSVQWRRAVLHENRRREVSTVQVGEAALYLGHGPYKSPPPIVESRRLDNGQPLWSLVLDGVFHPNAGILLRAPLATFKDGSFAAVTADWAVQRISKSGKRVWSKKTHGSPWRVFIDGDDRLIVGPAGDAKSRVAAYDRDGRLVWERPLPDSFARVYPGDRDRVLVQAGADKAMMLFALEGSCGRELWRVNLPENSVWPRVDVDGSVLVTSRIGGVPHLTRISPDGVVMFTKALNKNFSIARGPIGADGIQYVAACPGEDGLQMTLLGFDVKSGTQRFALPLGENLRCSNVAEPLLYPDGKLYIPTSSPNLQVIAVQTNSGGLANSVWPARGGGNRRLYATWPAHDKR